MERLKQLRGEKGLTQQEVSDAVGVARETYARYESGARTPDIDMLSRLADLFGVTTDYLLGRTDIPNAYIHEGIKLPGILYSTQKDLPPEDQEQVQELVQRALEDDGRNGVTLPGSSLDSRALEQFVERIVHQVLDKRDKQSNDQR